ncbi:MAG: universal stress protein [Chloroflexi bacterium]|nr:MAG: universal stress protein [Chloroflexota bacterium]
MGPIVCATRGGEASRRTQERAIALAKERNAELIFLCVVDPGFAGPQSDAVAAALEDELKRLGRSLLNIAQARAREQGIPAKVICLSGPVWEEIEAYLRRAGAATLVIGAPRIEPTSQAFGEDVQHFIQHVRQNLGIEVVVVP